MKNGKNIKIAIFVILAAVILILNHRYGWTAYLSSRDNIEQLRGKVATHYFEAVVIYVLGTAFACSVLAVPGVTFAVVAGILFDPITAIIACLAGATLGAILSFYVGKFFLKDGVKPLLEKNKTLNRLLFSGNENNYVFLLMITRLIPIFPFNLQNFAYGITDVKMSTYSVCTAVFMLPGVAVFTLATAGFTDKTNGMKYAIIASAIAAAAVIAGIYIKKKYLDDDEKTE